MQQKNVFCQYMRINKFQITDSKEKINLKIIDNVVHFSNAEILLLLFELSTIGVFRCLLTFLTKVSFLLSVI